MSAKKEQPVCLNARKALIDRSLRTYLNKYGVRNSDVFRAMRYAVFPGGKRIRPILCVEASIACGGNAMNSIIPACAIEFIHNFSLIHDDLPSMDNDKYRRGRLTCHSAFGEAVAILAGDALLALAFQALSDIKDAVRMRDIGKIIARATGVSGMIGGQGFDIKFAGKKKTRHMAFKINKLKTAALFEAAVKAGARAASAAPARLRALGVYGSNFGVAFQIRDDMRDGGFGGRRQAKKRQELGAAIEKARTSLDIFGKRGDNLKRIVEQLSEV